jgi:hypothetical protein
VRVDGEPVQVGVQERSDRERAVCDLVQVRSWALGEER